MSYPYVTDASLGRHLDLSLKCFAQAPVTIAAPVKFEAPTPVKPAVVQNVANEVNTGLKAPTKFGGSIS